MEQNVFVNGVAPGGLTSRSQVLLLVCYLLKSVGGPLSRNSIIQVIQANGLANYFEVTAAIGELLDRGHVQPTQGDDMLTVTETGSRIAQTLESDLPISVREKAVHAAMKLMTRIKLERENQVEINKTADGFTVVCHVSDGKRELMQVSLLVADRIQAEVIREDFLRDPGRVYAGVLALQTGDVEAFRRMIGV